MDEAGFSEEVGCREERAGFVMVVMGSKPVVVGSARASCEAEIKQWIFRSREFLRRGFSEATVSLFEASSLHYWLEVFDIPCLHLPCVSYFYYWTSNADIT